MDRTGCAGYRDHQQSGMSVSVCSWTPHQEIVDVDLEVGSGQSILDAANWRQRPNLLGNDLRGRAIASLQRRAQFGLDRCRISGIAHVANRKRGRAGLHQLVLINPVDLGDRRVGLALGDKPARRRKGCIRNSSFDGIEG